MKVFVLISLTSLALLSIPACQNENGSQDSAPEQASPGLDEAEVVEESLVPPQSWIDERVEKSRTRLQANEAGQMVWESIEAHGGLATFFEKGPLYFRFNYRPHGERAPRDTRQLVDTWSSRAIHEQSENPEIGFGWDGERAWEVIPEGEELQNNARFWALTPYYFVGLPFLLADPGVILKSEGEATLEGRSYDVVRATYEPGTGDAPDDFYVIYIHSETRLVEAIRYIVSYPGFFPDGGHSPESFMTYENHEEVDGLTFATFHRTFRWDEEAQWGGDHLTTTRVSEFEFRPDSPMTAFEAPEGARIIDGWE
ncbi:MAG: hypothetical protein ACNA8W_06850 [Bradymonadaceae bacterium]